MIFVSTQDHVTTETDSNPKNRSSTLLPESLRTFTLLVFYLPFIWQILSEMRVERGWTE